MQSLGYVSPSETPVSYLTFCGILMLISLLVVTFYILTRKHKGYNFSVSKCLLFLCFFVGLNNKHPNSCKSKKMTLKNNIFIYYDTVNLKEHKDRIQAEYRDSPKNI